MPNSGPARFRADLLDRSEYDGRRGKIVEGNLDVVANKKAIEQEGL